MRRYPIPHGVHHVIRALFIVAVLTLSDAHPVFAQQPLDPVLEDERRRQLERRTNELGTLQRRGGAPDPGPAQARVGPCFQIDRIVVEGVTLLTPEEVTAITSDYAPRCMQGADIQAAMRALDAVYAERGYITSKTYIPPQNLQEGTLTLTLVEGRVEDILMIDANRQIDSARGRRQLASAFPGRVGGLFQLRDFEQGLDQMNRLASVEALLKLQPGTEPGDSYVIVQRIQQDRMRAYLRQDNQGARSTGEERLSFDLEADDLLGVNDSWTFGYSGSENTNALSLLASVPYGYWTFETDLSYSEYLTPLTTLTELFGQSWSTRARARYVLSRDQISTTELIFGLQVRRSDRFINDVRLTPQNLTTFSYGIKHLRLGAKARNSYDATVVLGTTWLGADRDPPGLASGIPRAQFAKIEAGWQRQGGLGELGTLVTDLRAQWSPDSLFSPEQMALGSLSTVRGYDASVAIGDMGAYIRNDLYLPSDIWSFLPERLEATIKQRAHTNLFLDAGLTYDHARQTTEKAAGFGLGLSWYYKRITLSGVIGVPLVEADKAKLGDPVFQFRADLKTW